MPNPKVVLVTDNNSFAYSLLETLSQKKVHVAIKGNSSGWEESINRSIFVDEREMENYSYAIFLVGYAGNIESIQLELANEAIKKELKVIVVIPLLLSTSDSSKIKSFIGKIQKKFRNNVAIVFTADPIGLIVDPRSDRYVETAITQALSSGEVSIPKNAVINIVDSTKLAEKITSGLFSFGYYGDLVVISGQEIASEEWRILLMSVNPEVKFVVHKKEEESPYKKGSDIKVPFDFKSVIRNIRLKSVETKPLLSHEEKTNINKPKASKRAVAVSEKIETSTNEKLKGFNFYKLLVLIILLLMFPYLLLATDVLLSYISYKNVVKTLKIKDKTLVVLSKINDVDQGIARAYEKIPIIGKLYLVNLRGAELVGSVISLAGNVQTIQAIAKELATGIGGESKYQLGPLTASLEVELDSLYQQSGFFLNELSADRSIFGKFALELTSKYEINNLREKLLLGRDLSTQLEELIGGDTDKRYLVLMQNNMELRPTGGFIGSYAVATFRSGRLMDFSVSDVYSADGQLKGHIEPPEPIKTYLGEANWYLRDSNWNPDFPTSASRAEWFLEKEIDLSFDGVIATDLETVKGLLEVVGPLNIPDFGVSVSSNDLYEVTQAEVEEGFFPGSRKKRNFLAGLSQALMSEITTGSDHGVNLAKTLVNSLERKHLQVSLHNPLAQKTISSLEWDGNVAIGECDCPASDFGLVEANLGVNKANYFIERAFNFEVNVTESKINNRLEVTYKNNANPVLGEKSKYKSYLRLIVPKDARRNEVNIVSGTKMYPTDYDEDITGNTKEVGIFLEIFPGEIKKVIYAWEEKTNIDFTSGGDYILNWRKQAGTLSDPVLIEVVFPENTKLISPDGLTKPNVVSYNTNLARDISSRISW